MIQAQPATPAAATEPAVPQSEAEMSAKDLARAVLSRQITRPRVSSVRRLAEAVLAKGGKKAKKKKADKPDKKSRKLARIPGQDRGQDKAPKKP